MKPLTGDTAFERLVMHNGPDEIGDWRMIRATGALGLAGALFLRDTDTGCVVPLDAVKMMVPVGSAAPSVHDEITKEVAAAEVAAKPDGPDLNYLRPVDSLEFADAYRKGVATKSADGVRKLLVELNERITDLTEKGKPTPSYLLAAYRGYEMAILFFENPKAMRDDMISRVIRLDETR